PHSHIEVQISTVYHQGSTPDDHRPWIAPQIALSLSSQDYFSQKDPVLDAVVRAAPAATPAPSATITPLSAGQAVTFTTADGVVLGGTQYGRGAQAVIFSNIGNGQQADWQDLPQRVAQAGALALTYDWRGLGASRGAPDYTLSAQDLAAAIRWLRAGGVKHM